MSELGQKLIAAVIAKANENPDYVYTNHEEVPNSCVYVAGGKPSCIVGHALWDAGIIDAQFQTRPLNHKIVQEVVDALSLPVSEHEARWLRGVQIGQDSKWAWGKALEDAGAAPEK